MTHFFFNLKDFILPEKDVSCYYILVDEHTQQHCLPLLIQTFPTLEQAHVIRTTSGEENKNLQSFTHIIDELQKQQADRKLHLINLGGGVITDMGGFTASVYKRGITFSNIPTTLLGMVDAAIGHKNGLNHRDFKNQIGTFYAPENLVIDTLFLKTLPLPHLFSGYAEILKSALISSPTLYEDLQKQHFEDLSWNSIVPKIVDIKQQIVTQDPEEKGLRKILNFGHTFGHAFEHVAAVENRACTHGEAVASGMICEILLSEKIVGLPSRTAKAIIQYISTHFDLFPLEINQLETVLDAMNQDKKNQAGAIYPILLSDIGKPVWHQAVDASPIKEILIAYIEILKSKT